VYGVLQRPQAFWGEHNESDGASGTTTPARTPSERLFSKAGDVITKKRNRLAATKADRVVFLMDNL